MSLSGQASEIRLLPLSSAPCSYRYSSVMVTPVLFLKSSANGTYFASTTGGSVGASVGGSVGASVGGSVGLSVGFSVGFSVGAGVVVSAGFSVGVLLQAARLRTMSAASRIAKNFFIV